LLVVGAAVGAGIAVAVLAVWGRLADGPGGFPYAWFAFEFAAVAGAVLGGVLLPLVTWTVLPHVSFARILAETIIGTVAGAVLGILSDAMADPFAGIVGGFLGFIASVIQLRVRRPRTVRLGASATDET
jgi:hypothetical protein